MTRASVRARRIVSLVLVCGFVLWWHGPVFSQTAVKTWKTVEELSSEERAELDFRTETPRETLCDLNLQRVVPGFSHRIPIHRNCRELRKRP